MASSATPAISASATTSGRAKWSASCRPRRRRTRTARERGSDMSERGAEEFPPERRSLKALGEAVGECHGCDLYRDATQAVFGAGPAKAPLMLVGETPGDREDIERRVVRRPGRRPPAQRVGRGRDRGRRRLPDQRGQALQVAPAGQAVPAPDAADRRDERLPPVARGRGRRGRRRRSSPSAPPRPARSSARRPK
mgnify:CR=1 FL=1